MAQSDTGHAAGSALARVRCPRCRGPGMRSLGFVRARHGYVRRVACKACGHVCNDEEALLRPVRSTADAPARCDDEGMSVADREAVETIALLLGSGGTSLDDMEVSEASLGELVTVHGPPTSFLRGFAFPAYCWRKADDADDVVWLVAIDQGRLRVCFNTRRIAGNGRPDGEAPHQR